jgi:epoxyqueuosine reductase
MIDRERLRAALAELGFDDVRFAAASPAVRGALPEWLASGMQADMAWMARTEPKRLDPQLVLPGARTVIMLGVSYWSEQLRFSPQAGASPRWARYALHEDYHDTIKPALEAAGKILQTYGDAPEDHRWYVDTGPVLERSWAARAGLGFNGKNAMLISRRHGNWLFLAAILTRLTVEPDEPIRRGSAADTPVGALCGRCTRCLDACPTQAFARPGLVDARRCVSYQTIENKGIIPRELRAGVGERIYGCDICLEVCPWNRFAREGRRLLVSARHELAELTLADILALTTERFATVFRRTAVKRLKLSGLLRNACVVAGNRGDPELIPLLRPLAAAPTPPMVRAHAVWALRRLGDEAALNAQRLNEQDPQVLAEYEA